MIDLFYPSTYHAIKAGPCRVGVCKYKGECGKCKEYGALRRYAARDIDRIHELRALVKAKDREVDELRECLKEAIRDKCPFTRMSCKHGEPCDYECGTFKWRKALQDEGGAK